MQPKKSSFERLTELFTCEKGPEYLRPEVVLAEHPNCHSNSQCADLVLRLRSHRGTVIEIRTPDPHGYTDFPGPLSKCLRDNGVLVLEFTKDSSSAHSDGQIRIGVATIQDKEAISYSYGQFSFDTDRQLTESGLINLVSNLQPLSAPFSA